MRDGGPPRGYTQFDVRNARVVCMESVASDFRLALRDSTLYDFAARHVEARTFAGRGASYAIPLSSSGELAVVRHNRHGGMLAPLTSDLFRLPTRAPLELAVSERLRSLDISTPQLLGYVRYAVAPGFARVDVATREVRDSSDLSTAFASRDSVARELAVRATASLIKSLADVGARHHDLNIKNVLLQAPAQSAVPRAFVLDVDRVSFGLPRHAAIEANVSRLIRSARKWQRLHTAAVTGAELDMLAGLVRDQ